VHPKQNPQQICSEIATPYNVGLIDSSGAFVGQTSEIDVKILVDKVYSGISFTVSTGNNCNELLEGFV